MDEGHFGAGSAGSDGYAEPIDRTPGRLQRPSSSSPTILDEFSSWRTIGYSERRFCRPAKASAAYSFEPVATRTRRILSATSTRGAFSCPVRFHGVGPRKQPPTLAAKVDHNDNLESLIESPAATRQTAIVYEERQQVGTLEMARSVVLCCRKGFI